MSSRRYEFHVSGRLSERTSGAFSELVVMRAPPETILYGDIEDEARLHGVLATMQDLGMRVVAPHEVPD
jgi:hypothetical protein